MEALVEARLLYVKSSFLFSGYDMYKSTRILIINLKVLKYEYTAYSKVPSFQASRISALNLRQENEHHFSALIFYSLSILYKHLLLCEQAAKIQTRLLRSIEFQSTEHRHQLFCMYSSHILLGSSVTNLYIFKHIDCFRKAL